MQLHTKLPNKIYIIYALFSLLSISILFSCGDNPESGKTAPATDKPESFTFFELGTNTPLTERVILSNHWRFGSLQRPFRFIFSSRSIPHVSGFCLSVCRSHQRVTSEHLSDEIINFLRHFRSVLAVKSREKSSVFEVKSRS